MAHLSLTGHATIGEGRQYDIFAASDPSRAHRLNEDVFGFVELQNSLFAWVIDGASPLAPANNETIHCFAATFSVCLQSAIASDRGLPEILHLARQIYTVSHPDLIRHYSKLPKYAQPLAAVTMVKLYQSNDRIAEVSYLCLGDCAIAFNDGSPPILQKSRSELYLRRLTQRPTSASQNEIDKRVICYQKARRRRQMQKGYCRWLTLAIDGCEQGIFGTRELRKEAKFILCSDGYYNPLVTSVHEFGDLIADSEFYGIMHMMERRKMMEGRSPLIQSKYYDDATAILIIPRVNY